MYVRLFTKVSSILEVVTLWGHCRDISTDQGPDATVTEICCVSLFEDVLILKQFTVHICFSKSDFQIGTFFTSLEKPFGRSVNPIATKGGRLCPPNNNGTSGFSDLP